MRETDVQRLYGFSSKGEFLPHGWTSVTQPAAHLHPAERDRSIVHCTLLYNTEHSPNGINKQVYACSRYTLGCQRPQARI
jgi:hypothetical protein